MRSLTIGGLAGIGRSAQGHHTASDGYYRGARYHGAVQMLIEPTGRRMVGKWVGFGKNMEINTGPWALTFQDASTSKATLDSYNQPPSG